MISCVICYFGYNTIYDQDFNFLNNNRLNTYLKMHAANHIIKVYKKYILRKKIYKYSDLLLDKYYNPKSIYLLYNNMFFCNFAKCNCGSTLITLASMFLDNNPNIPNPK